MIQVQITLLNIPFIIMRNLPIFLKVLCHLIKNEQRLPII